MRHYYSFSEYEQSGFDFARKTFDDIAKTLNAEIITSAAVSAIPPDGHDAHGEDPQNSVTDPFGRSHDHKNLFILSTSLFPSASSVNPTLTLAALSLRAAGQIARQLGGK